MSAANSVTANGLRVPRADCVLHLCL